MRLVLLLLFTAALANATVINVPSDYSLIQSAINASVSRDTIRVSPGTYYENIDFSGKEILLVSTDGAATTIIDASASGSVVKFTSSETRKCIIDGFTLQNGTGTFITPYYYGGGINCTGSSPTIRNNIIRDNSGLSGGAVLCYTGGCPLLEYNTIEGNTADNYGAGVYITSSSADLVGNVIRNNNASSGAGITSAYNSSCTAHNNLIHNNEASKGAAVYALFNGTVTLQNCTVANNTGTTSSGGLYGFNSNFTVINCILWGNTAPTGAQCNLNNGSGVFSWSDIQGGESEVLLEGSATAEWGNGMIDSDPLLQSGPLSEYHTGTGSPCIDFGNPATQYNDTEDISNPGNPLWPALGTLVCDMGVYGGSFAGGWVSVEDFSETIPEQAVNISPLQNPAGECASVNCSFTGNQAEILIYDATGRLVTVETLLSPGAVTLSTRNLRNGIHFLRLVTPSGTASAKLMLLN